MRANTISLVKSIAKLYSATRDADRQMCLAATFHDGDSSILTRFDERGMSRSLLKLSKRSLRIEIYAA